MEQANEDLRAQYRYLDLRRQELADNLKLRSKVAHITRNYLHDQGTLRPYLQTEKNERTELELAVAELLICTRLHRD